MEKLKKIIIASNNKHKIDEIKDIFKDFKIEVISQSDAGIDIEVEENGSTFLENAMIKATAIAKLTNEAVLADDSGLEVFALNGEPGIYSARFSGEDCNYKKNNQKLIGLMEGVPYEKRGARFVCVMVLYNPSKDTIIANGEVQGFIGYEENGDFGFGYDPLFIVPEYNKTFAQLTPDEKNSISHRGRALYDLKNKLSCNYNI